MTGDDLPTIITAVPGPRSRAAVDRLAERECPAITARRARRAASLGVADTDPVVWDEALGSNVQDLDGNVFVDLTAGFGVASVGHRAPAVVAAAQRQQARLVHAMGDAFPDASRIALLEVLAARTGLDRAILGTSGSDAVEAALKTACIATGRDGVIAFSGGYHGLSYGALAVTAYKAEAFREPFAGQIGHHVRHHPFGGRLPAGTDWDGVGAVIVEPIQGRGGVRAPPGGWLAELAERARDHGALVIFDEIYTGFGRTGRWFAFETTGVRPDLLCVGKSMAGGFPLSACVGTAAAMDAWGASRGEALHTQTFLGHPVGCAAALAGVELVAKLLPEVEPKGRWLRTLLEGRGYSVRGEGLLLGVELGDRSYAVSRALMERGYIVLPAGERSEVLALTPPLVITRGQLSAFVDALVEVTA